MKRFLSIAFGLFICIMLICGYTLKTGISAKTLPPAILGSWQVEAQLIETNAGRTFKPISTDLWNLSRVGNVLKLENPFSGANADVSIQASEGNVVVFTKKSEWDNKILTDVVSIRLENESFSGINEVALETNSIIDGHLVKKETARYKIKGKKLSGATILK